MNRGHLIRAVITGAAFGQAALVLDGWLFDAWVQLAWLTEIVLLAYAWTAARARR